MLYLISTTHHLLALDTATDAMYRVHTGQGLYYGLCAHERLVYAACRNQIHGPQDEALRSRESGSILVFDEDSKVVEELRADFPLRDMHGIACIDRKLWVTCSFDNLIAIFDLRTRQWTKWYPNPAIQGRDVNHFNTIEWIGDRICVVAHNFGRSHLLFYRYPELELESALELGYLTHNAFHLYGSPATCNSGEGLIENARGRKIRTGYFPRGFREAGGEILVGLSPITPRAQRDQTDALVRRYSNDWRHTADYVLPRVGVVLDIIHLVGGAFHHGRLTPWPDRQIVHGRYASPEDTGYTPGTNDRSPAHAADWHAPEGALRWTAARCSKIPIVINPGEDRLTARLYNGYPGPFHAELCIGDQTLGAVEFGAPEMITREFKIPSGLEGEAELWIKTPHLWQPADVLPGSSDQRRLGIGVLLIAPASASSPAPAELARSEG